ncbi:transcription factor LATE FLOWERING [Punica granatum]|uniref:BHLH domain-containing protein n=2 Tax=Punica granatum TaxID=22663 RepID=A0A218XB13_PUNGR|nr:transcription factor LATE FLOWERING [Punica granatum]OWM81691.1 hypothetical protein CDL15_Pgr007729 [Punica granatum]PKI34106.1 hypothetical protein CRG98_045461 [Punica granatum]
MNHQISSKEKTGKVAAGINKKSSPSPLIRQSKTGAKKLSTDPQSVAARQRRHRISDRFKTLQSLVPGAHKMDTVSMLDGAIKYVKFLKAQILLHHQLSMLFSGRLHPNSGYECDIGQDNRYYYYCHNPDSMATESSSSGSAAEPVDDHLLTPNPRPPTFFSGAVEVQPAGSPQLPDFPALGPCVDLGEETMLYYGGSYT